MAQSTAPSPAAASAAGASEGAGAGAAASPVAEAAAGSSSSVTVAGDSAAPVAWSSPSDLLGEEGILIGVEADACRRMPASPCATLPRACRGSQQAGTAQTRPMEICQLCGHPARCAPAGACACRKICRPWLTAKYPCRYHHPRPRRSDLAHAAHPVPRLTDAVAASCSSDRLSLFSSLNAPASASAISVLTPPRSSQAPMLRSPLCYK